MNSSVTVRAVNAPGSWPLYASTLAVTMPFGRLSTKLAMGMPLLASLRIAVEK